MTRYAFTIEFDGTPFAGLQRQKDAPTVQQAIEDALFRITGEKALLFSAGRTDAGVHALGMRSHADIEKPLTPFRLMEALNAHLRPDPVAITHCEIVPDEWHARFSCTARAYEYRIANRRAPLTLEKDRAWLVPQELDADAMHRSAQALVGVHDFTTFRSAHCQADSPVRSIDRIAVRREGMHIIAEVEARSFLHHQVRSIVGCLALVGMGRWREEQVGLALAARDRQELGLNAPAHGLYFVRATYPPLEETPE